MIDELELIRQASNQAIQPQPAGDGSSTATALLVRLEASGLSCWVSLLGGEPVRLACQPGSYVGITTVTVLMRAGKPVHVLGPAGNPTVDDDEVAEKNDAIDTPKTTTKTVRGAVIRPSWSGTWRVSRGAWDRWNVGVHGGRSDLYQGSNSGSGQLYGVAVYGSQIVNLRASEITRMAVTLIPNGSIGAGLSVGVLLQAVSGGGQPSGAPSFVGSTAASQGLTAGGTFSFELPAGIREALRTGSAGGLAIVGSSYQAVYGTSRSNGMSLNLDYTTKS